MNNATSVEDGLTTFLKASLVIQEVLFAVVCIVGLLGNTLVIYVVVRFSKMQTVTNMYIVNLAIADECFLIGIPFLIVTMIEKQWIFGETMCRAYLVLTCINQFTSSIFLFVMSADRYIAVCHPISSPKWRTPTISRIVSIAAWTCSVILMIPIFNNARAVPKAIPHGNGTIVRSSCVIEWPKNNASTNGTEPALDSDSASTFTMYTFIFSFATPLCLILVFYCLVIRKLKTVGPQNKSKEKKRSHRKVTRLVLTVVAVYVFCWLPYWVMQITSIFNSPSESKFLITLHLLASCLSYSNSAMNPILYAFLSDNFKKSFLKACTCAAGRDVNAALHLENSVFPRKNKQQSSAKTKKQPRGTSIGANDEEEEGGPLMAAKGEAASASASAVTTVTSRSNVTLAMDARENNGKETKNGVLATIQPIDL